MDIIDIRTFTTIPMPGIHMHIIPLPQAIGIADNGLITATIDTIITTTIELTSLSQLWFEIHSLDRTRPPVDV
jgi:hypothetical protein